MPTNQLQILHVSIVPNHCLKPNSPLNLCPGINRIHMVGQTFSLSCHPHPNDFRSRWGKNGFCRQWRGLGECASRTRQQENHAPAHSPVDTQSLAIVPSSSHNAVKIGDSWNQSRTSLPPLPQRFVPPFPAPQPNSRRRPLPSLHASRRPLPDHRTTRSGLHGRSLPTLLSNPPFVRADRIPSSRGTASSPDGGIPRKSGPTYSSAPLSAPSCGPPMPPASLSPLIATVSTPPAVFSC